MDIDDGLIWIKWLHDQMAHCPNRYDLPLLIKRSAYARYPCRLLTCEIIVDAIIESYESDNYSFETDPRLAPDVLKLWVWDYSDDLRMDLRRPIDLGLNFSDPRRVVVFHAWRIGSPGNRECCQKTDSVPVCEEFKRSRRRL